jgi:hypothetical protein
MHHKYLSCYMVGGSWLCRGISLLFEDLSFTLLHNFWSSAVSLPHLACRFRKFMHFSFVCLITGLCFYAIKPVYFTLLLSHFIHQLTAFTLIYRVDYPLLFSLYTALITQMFSKINVNYVDLSLHCWWSICEFCNFIYNIVHSSQLSSNLSHCQFCLLQKYRMYRFRTSRHTVQTFQLLISSYAVCCHHSTSLHPPSYPHCWDTQRNCAFSVEKITVGSAEVKDYRNTFWYTQNFTLCRY